MIRRGLYYKYEVADVEALGFVDGAVVSPTDPAPDPEKEAGTPAAARAAAEEPAVDSFSAEDDREEADEWALAIS